MPDTPISVSRDNLEVAEYKLHIQVNEQIREELAMLAVARRIWLEKSCDVNTNYDRICEDPVFWNDQNVHDLDINRLHKQIVGGAHQYMKGDVIIMEKTTPISAQMTGRIYHYMKEDVKFVET